MSFLAYLCRASWTLISFGEPCCRATRCGRPTVGFSSWCREHTDRVLEDRVTPDMIGVYEVGPVFPTQPIPPPIRVASLSQFGLRIPSPPASPRAGAKERFLPHHFKVNVRYSMTCCECGFVIGRDGETYDLAIGACIVAATDAGWEVGDDGPLCLGCADV